MLVSRALAVGASCKSMLRRSFVTAMTQRVFPLLTQTRVHIQPPPLSSAYGSLNNNQPAITTQQTLRNPLLGNSNTMADDPYVVLDSDSEVSDDPMLALAIRLSLQQDARHIFRPQANGESSNSGALSRGGSSSEATGKRKADLIVISDTESEDMDRLPPTRKAPRATRESSASASARVQRQTISPPSTGGVRMLRGNSSEISSVMGLDRAQMERERLERLGQKAFPTSATAASEPSGGGEKPSSSDNKPKSEASAPPNARSQAIQLSNAKFWNGAVKKTWVYGVERDGTDIKFEEVLQKETLIGLVLSAFQWDHEWLWTKIPPKQLQRFAMVMQAKNEEVKKAILDVLGGLPRTTIVFPPMEGSTVCMHSKLMLMFHHDKHTKKEWLRVAVPSANLTDYDWGERGSMENTVFLIDLPKLQPPQTKENTLFQEGLLYFCKAKGIPTDVLEKLNQYDFSRTQGMAFVHSIGGIHFGDSWKRTGYPGLGTAIRTLGYSTGKGLELDLVSSSLGATDRSFIMNMYRAAQGFDGMLDLKRRLVAAKLDNSTKVKAKKKSTKAQKKRVFVVEEEEEEEEEEVKYELASDTESDVEMEYDEETDWERVEEKFRLYFPSRGVVEGSKGGAASGGTICFQSQWWDDQKYPREVVRECKSVRERILMHNKMIFARPAKQLDTPAGKVDAWAYVGSANFSESAWGKLSQTPGKRGTKVTCKNWECGVIVPVMATKESEEKLSGKAPERPARTEPVGMEVFGDSVPVPMVTPGELMDGRVLKPWYHHQIMMLEAQDRKGAEKRQRKLKIKRWS